MTPTPKYAADIHGVKEVILTGHADYAYWRDLLAPAGLTPLRVDGQASLLISATELRWMGFHFNEVVVSIALDADAYYLIQAFNSSRLMAWSERTFFGTPYAAASLDVATGAPAQFAIALGGQPVLRAAMADRADPPPSPNDECWEGRIYLPAKDGAPGQAYFLAHLSGPTGAYPYSAADTFDIGNTAPPPLRRLPESGFRPSGWRLRADGRHAKAATVRP